MSTKSSELKAINVEKKALAAKAKAIREELNATKEQRKESTKDRKISRDAIKSAKMEIRECIGSLHNVLKTGDSMEIVGLADEATESCAKFSSSLRTYADLINELEEL